MTPYTATIRSNGKVMSGTVELLSIEVRRELDRIPEARLVVVDGSVATGKFEESNSDFFALGNLIDILLRRGDEPDKQIFSGLVVRHSVELHKGNSELRVELKDRALALTRARRSAVYVKKSDHEIIDERIKAANLKVGKIDKTTVKHAELIQHHATDWDFLLSRADVNGLVILVDDGAVSARKMTHTDKSTATFTYGSTEVDEFELSLDGAEQWRAVASSAWNAGECAPSTTVTASPVDATAGNLVVGAVAPKLGGDTDALLLPAPAAPAELKAWADARLARSRLAQLRGRLVVPGEATIKPLHRITIAGIGDRFNGALLISGIVHRVDHEGWWTELQLGLPPERFSRRPDIADAPAGGLLPPATQLQIGVVDPFEKDPENEQRVRVRLPGLGPIWARIARPDAGEDRGYCFSPEAGDQVVVGFLAGDPRQAVVLGALFGAGRQPPGGGELTESNDKRALVSRSGIRLGFDDKTVALTLETPAGHKFVLDDKAESITLTDKHDNRITMDANGIQIKSARDLSLDATGNVVIKGTAVDIQ